VNVPGVADLELLASGANGSVYSGREIGLDRSVAVKVMRAGLDGAERRFEREKRAMGRLSNVRGVAPIYRVGTTDDGSPYLVMPLYKRSAQQLIEQKGALDWRVAHEVISSISEAVGKAHEADILHLDIKPSNILLDSQGSAILADFGIAEFADADASMSAAMMTPQYSAPERFYDKRPTTASDIYSLGATLLALLTGQAPFSTTNNTSPAVAMQLILNEPPRVDSIPATVPAHVPDAIARAMSKEPADRPTTTVEFLGTLEPQDPPQQQAGASNAVTPPPLPPAGREAAAVPETIIRPITDQNQTIRPRTDTPPPQPQENAPEKNDASQTQVRRKALVLTAVVAILVFLTWLLPFLTSNTQETTSTIRPATTTTTTTTRSPTTTARPATTTTRPTTTRPATTTLPSSDANIVQLFSPDSYTLQTVYSLSGNIENIEVGSCINDSALRDSALLEPVVVDCTTAHRFQLIHKTEKPTKLTAPLDEEALYAFATNLCEEALSDVSGVPVDKGTFLSETFYTPDEFGTIDCLRFLPDYRLWSGAVGSVWEVAGPSDITYDDWLAIPSPRYLLPQARCFDGELTGRAIEVADCSVSHTFQSVGTLQVTATTLEDADEEAGEVCRDAVEAATLTDWDSSGGLEGFTLWWTGFNQETFTDSPDINCYLSREDLSKWTGSLMPRRLPDWAK